MECTKDRQYFLIESLRRNDMNATEVHNIISRAWPEECLSVVQIRKIMRDFNTGDRETFKRKDGSGRRKSEHRLENINAVRELLDEERNLTEEQIARRLEISNSMVHRILQDDLEMIWFRTKWVPHTLTEGNKAVRVDRCHSLIDSLSTRLCKANLVTIDEKWFYCRNLKPKHRIGTWLSQEMIFAGDGPSQTGVRSTMEKKMMVIVALSQKGYHYFEILEQNQSINAERYVVFIGNLINFLQNSPEPIQPENLRLMHDNARPHVARHTAEYIASRNIRLLPQPPYSPDVNLCDSYLFKRLESLRTDFNNIDDLRTFLNNELPHFNTARMGRALDNSIVTMRKIIEANGCYVK